MEFLFSKNSINNNIVNKISLDKITSYDIENEYNDSYYFNAILDNGEKITLFNICPDNICFECKLSEDNIIRILSIIEEKEHQYEIVEYNNNLYSDMSLIILNRIFTCIYKHFNFNIDRLMTFYRNKYKSDELKYIGVENNTILYRTTFTDKELSHLLLSKNFFGFTEGNKLEFSSDLKEDLPNVKCNLFIDDNKAEFDVFINKDKINMNEGLRYGIYSIDKKYYIPFKKDVDRDELKALIIYVYETNPTAHKEYYKNIFRQIIKDNNYLDDYKICSYYKELFGESVNENDVTKDFSFINQEKGRVIFPTEKVNINNSDLEKYAINLNSINYKYDPAVGRNNEIRDVLVSLVHGSSILIGEAGVGKTALVEGISYKLQKGEVPKFLQGKEIYKITSSDLVSGCGIVGDIEKRMKNILDEVIRRENIILFFDEMHTAIGTGKGKDGTLDIANILKPYVDRGQIKMIGATTTKEYDEYFERDPAFKRRYEKVIIKEPDDSALYEIISCVMDGEESILNVSLSNNINKDKLIESLIRLTMKNHRDQLNMEYNPALVLSILKKAYSYAVYNEHDYLDINDIEEAISKCSLVSKPAKDEFLRYEKDLFIENNKVKSKIIEFNK